MAIVVSTGNAKKPASLTSDDRKKRRQARVLLEGGLVLVVLCFGLLLRAWAYEGVLIISNSMQPTLAKGDYTLLDHRAAIRGTWKRGDVVAFGLPATWKGTNETLVKRVIGLPGEVVEVSSGTVFINGQALTETYLEEPAEIADPIRVTLGPNQFWVMGDNRNNSDDSRDNGPIEESDIKGRVLSKLWPKSRFAPLEQARLCVARWRRDASWRDAIKRLKNTFRMELKTTNWHKPEEALRRIKIG